MGDLTQIYDEEMWAIMDTLDHWRWYLIGTQEPFEVWTDHQNLFYSTSKTHKNSIVVKCADDNKDTILLLDSLFLWNIIVEGIDGQLLKHIKDGMHQVGILV